MGPHSGSLSVLWCLPQERCEGSASAPTRSIESTGGGVVWTLKRPAKGPRMTERGVATSHRAVSGASGE